MGDGVTGERERRMQARGWMYQFEQGERCIQVLIGDKLTNDEVVQKAREAIAILTAGGGTEYEECALCGGTGAVARR